MALGTGSGGILTKMDLRMVVGEREEEEEHFHRILRSSWTAIIQLPKIRPGLKIAVLKHHQHHPWH
jgi:hypothetical protein